MTLTCDICSLIFWPWLLWERRRANPLIAGGFLSQAGGEERNGNWLWGPPPLHCHCSTSEQKWCGRIKLILWLFYEKDKAFPFLWWDGANANCLLLCHNAMGSSTAMCVLHSPPYSRIQPPLWRPLLRHQWEFRGVLILHSLSKNELVRTFPGTDSGVEACPGPPHTCLHTLGHPSGILLYHRCGPSEEAAGCWQQKNLCFSHS